MSARAQANDTPQRSERWTFLTNHGHALICIARDPRVRLRDIASLLGVTERTAQAIVNDLVDGGYVVRTRVGNRSQYVVRASLPLRHQVERDHAVGELIDLMAPAPAGNPAPQRRPRHDT
jgi:DNA-binding MarR family transcriptional regulator